MAETSFADWGKQAYSRFAQSRRAEGIVLLVKKFRANAETCFPLDLVQRILAGFESVKRLERMALDEFVEDFENSQ